MPFFSKNATTRLKNKTPAQQNKRAVPQPPQGNDVPAPPREDTTTTMTIMFTKFGGRACDVYLENSFDQHQKIRLMNAVWDAVDASEIVYQAAKSNFKDHLDKLKLWFGIENTQADFKRNVQIVKEGINKMHNVLTDPSKLLTLVDTRRKLIIAKKIVTENAPGIDPKFRAMREKAITLNNRYTGIGSWAHCTVLSPPELTNQDRYFLPRPYTKHVGSGYRIYIWDNVVFSGTDPKIRAHVIYHEMTHKVLNSTDVGVGNVPVIGSKRCKEVAMGACGPLVPLQLAESWAFFVMTFLDPPEQECIIL